MPLRCGGCDAPEKRESWRKRRPAPGPCSNVILDTITGEASAWFGGRGTTAMAVLADRMPPSED